MIDLVLIIVLAIWDINHNGLSSSPISSQNLGGITTNSDEYKRGDLTMNNHQVWKSFFEHGVNEQCHSLTWFKPNEKLFAAGTTNQNTNKHIKIYDPRGFSLSFISSQCQCQCH